MELRVRNRKTNELTIIKEDKTTLFFYDTLIGRIILKFIIRGWLSKLVGIYMNSSWSSLRINKFIHQNNINMKDYKKERWKSFNDFFIRRLRHKKIDMKPSSFIAPCDGKLSVYKINKESLFKIKDSYYSVNDLVNQDISKEYINGYCLIFRLCVDDYHRFHYLDDGIKTMNKYIKGELHTVRPIALKKYNIYKRNAREWTRLHTKNFGDIIQIEVGALMVGKIVNHHQEYEFKRGEEKGYFIFGGSTVVLLVKENQVVIDRDILENSKEDIETTVKLGEKIGGKKT